MASAVESAVARVAALTTLSVIVVVGCSIERYGRTAVGPAPFDLGTPIDAAIDIGSPLDARPVIDDAHGRDARTRPDLGLDAARDAAVDLGSRDLGAADTGPIDAGPAADTGPEPDADTPVCPAGCDCEQSCSAEACDCSGGCPCTLSCSGFCSGKCDQAETICTLDANGVVASTFGCDHGATCEVHVSASTSLTIDCRHDSSCDVECTASAPCIVRCREGARCVLRCDASVCTITDCPMMMLRNCGGGVQVCNRACPT